MNYYYPSKDVASLLKSFKLHLYYKGQDTNSDVLGSIHTQEFETNYNNRKWGLSLYLLYICSLQFSYEMRKMLFPQVSVCRRNLIGCNGME